MKRTVVLLVIVIGLAGAGHGTAAAPGVDAEPGVVTMHGGSAEDRAMIVWAVGRFTSQSMALPRLEIRLHRDTSGCGGHEGYYTPASAAGQADRIDLCSRRVQTALHELAHAWEHHQLSDPARDSFLEATGLTAWNDHDDAWSRRGMEVAANTVAFGLLDGAANQAQRTLRADEFALFSRLTGSPSPRLSESQHLDGWRVGGRLDQSPESALPLA